jgi:hypothetical protein
VSYYTQKRFLVEVVKVTDSDGFLQNEDTDYYPVSKNDVVLKDGVGRLYTVTKDQFNENYLEVVKVEKKETLSNFTYEDIAAGYQAMANLDQEEDAEYIQKLKNNLSDKPC